MKNEKNMFVESPNDHYLGSIGPPILANIQS